MSKLTIKPTIHDAFESIWNDFLYPCMNTISNTTDWIPSRDIQNQQSLMAMELEEQFVEIAAKSDELPYDLDKSLAGTIVKKENRLAPLFYDWLRQQNEIAVNPGLVNPSSFLATFKISNCDRVQNAQCKVTRKK